MIIYLHGLGSSLGGFYATWLAEKHNVRAVLINPAIDPHVGLRTYLGPQQAFHGGDEVLDYRAAVRKYRGAKQVVVQGGDHSLASFPEQIPLILEFAGMN